MTDLHKCRVCGQYYDEDWEAEDCAKEDEDELESGNNELEQEEYDNENFFG